MARAAYLFVQGFSALQRAEIAEIRGAPVGWRASESGFSALQRAEIAEISSDYATITIGKSFSALQRAEIAEIEFQRRRFTH